MPCAARRKGTGAPAVAAPAAISLPAARLPRCRRMSPTIQAVDRRILQQHANLLTTPSPRRIPWRGGRDADARAKPSATGCARSAPGAICRTAWKFSMMSSVVPRSTSPGAIGLWPSAPRQSGRAAG
jgi:hypothetical protein